MKTVTIELTESEQQLLLALLSLDLDAIGFEFEEIEALDLIYDKINQKIN